MGTSHEAWRSVKGMWPNLQGSILNFHKDMCRFTNVFVWILCKKVLWYEWGETLKTNIFICTDVWGHQMFWPFSLTDSGKYLFWRSGRTWNDSYLLRYLWGGAYILYFQYFTYDVVIYQQLRLLLINITDYLCPWLFMCILNSIE